jgi:aminopeptidase N
MVRDFSVLASPSFAVSSRQVGDVKVSAHFLREERNAGKRVLSASVHSLRTFEKHFGPYPYADLDVVEAPLVGGAGGVEFSGLVTVASMLYRPVTAGGEALGGLLPGGFQRKMMQQTFDSMLEFVTAHEVAHQYWHILVGSDSRNHPFNDEALCQFSALLYMEKRYGKKRADQEAMAQLVNGYRMMRMFGQQDGAADRPVDEFPSALAYGGLVYGKAPLVYRVIRKKVGDAFFFSTLREYVRRYWFGTAPRRGFIEMLAAADPSVRRIARRWLDEAHGDEDLQAAGMEQLLGEFSGEERRLITPPKSADGKGGEVDSEQLMEALKKLYGGEDGEDGILDYEQIEQLLESLGQ